MTVADVLPSGLATGIVSGGWLIGKQQETRLFAG
jgi:hypothetical protein